MNGYLLFGRLDAADGDRLFELVGADRPLRAAALGATGAPGAIAAYDAPTIAAARRQIDDVLAAGLTPLDHLVYAGAWNPAPTPRVRPGHRARAAVDESTPTEPTEPADPTEPTEPTDPTEPTEPPTEPPAEPGQPGQPEPMEPGRVFGLPVAPDGVLAVTCLLVPPPAVRTAMGVAYGSRTTAVSPVTGGPWNLLFEHVAPDVGSLQQAIDGTHTALAAAGVEVTASTSLYASHGLFRTTNPNTPPPAGPGA